MTIAQQWKEEGRQEVMTIAKQWEAEGLQKGLQKGMIIAKQWKEEGRQEGEARLLQFQLQRRFGSIPSRYVQRIETADTNTLLYWAGELLDAETLEDVFDER